MSPKVTVLMSVFNGERYLKEAVNSILSQTFNDFEFLIIDDGSTDQSLQIIQSYDDSRIRLVRNDKNLGLAKSLNKGISLSRGEYIARMDADDISLPDRLNRQVAMLDVHPEIAVVGTAIKKIDYDGKMISEYYPRRNPKFSDFLRYNHVVHGSILARKQVLESIGGYREQFRYCQDYTLFLQIAKDYRIHNLPDILYFLRVHNQSVSIKYINKSVAFHIAAVRIVHGKKMEYSKYPFSDSDEQQFLDSLNNDEQYYYHKSRADCFRTEKNMINARQEYKNAIKIKPLSYSLINLFRTYSGVWIMDTTTKCYLNIRNFLKNVLKIGK